MTATSVERDVATLTMTITADLDAPVARVWRLWEDPRQLERWWGPPMYPATFVEHELVPGATVTYFTTGPGGDQPRGWWRVLAVDAPHHLEYENGFADDAGGPSPDMATMIIRTDLHDHDGGTRMAIVTTFPSLAAMEQILSMGMQEGMTAAISQVDGLLAIDIARR